MLGDDESGWTAVSGFCFRDRGKREEAKLGDKEVSNSGKKR